MDYEVAVIGSGSAGKEAALLAAKQGRRVVVIEKEALGGACFHRGCFPIRALRAYANNFGNHQFAGPGGINPVRAQIQNSWAKVRRQVSDQLADQLNRQFQEAHEAEAVDAGMDVIAGSETTRWMADEAIRMLDPYPTAIKVVLDARTKRLLGCLAIGEQAVEVANVCSILLKSEIPNERLAGFRFAHPSAAEALQRCVDSIINKRERAGSVNPGGVEPQPVARRSEAEPLEPQLAAEESTAEPLERNSSSPNFE